MEQNKLFKQLNDSKEIEVAVVGLGFRLPSGNTNKSNQTSDQLWNGLMNSFNGVVDINTRWNENFLKLNEIGCSNAGLIPLNEWKSFDPMFFGIAPSEVPTIDPQQRLLLKCTWEALEDAGIDPIVVRGTDTSVHIGCSTIDYRDINRNLNSVQKSYFGTSTHSISNRISYCFDFHGASMTIDSACSSSATAIALGYENIKNGKSNLSIVGGVNMIADVYSFKSFSLFGVLSKKAGKCMTFDEDADGYVRSEGAGVAVLKPLKQAIKDGNTIYCVINGSSINVDGNGFKDKLNFYSPSSLSQAENIKKALNSTNGKVLASDLDYIECHGTGTPTGDPIEVKGISMVISDSNTYSQENPLFIGSIKPNIGHMEACSGIASLIKCCLMFKNQIFVPNANFKKVNPKIKLKEWNLKVVTEPIKFNQNKNISMVISNFGVTGSNVCLVLQQFKTKQINPQFNGFNFNKNYLIPFSSNSIRSMENYKSLINIKDDEEFIKFISKQINSKSLSLYQRSIIISNDSNQFNNKDKIKYQTFSNKPSNISSFQKDPILVFVFCGQGSQYNTMGKELYDNEPVFKFWMDLIDLKLFKYFGYSILEKLRSIQDSDSIEINQQMIVQPSNLMFQVSLLEFYKHWGINPSFVIGHSIGELSAAYCSGMIDLDTLCYLIYNRAVPLQSTQGKGRMLSINISAEQFKNEYSQKYPTLEISCYNSPSSIVISGNEDQLNEILNDSKEKQVFSKMLGSLTPIHTTTQMLIKDEILNLKFNSKQPEIPHFSTVTSNLFNSTLSFDSEYVFENILKPVQFENTINNLYGHIEKNELGSNITFFEISPHPTLLFYLKQMMPKNSIYFNNGDTVSILSSLKRKSSDLKEIQKTISELYCNSGYNKINFNCQFNSVIKNQINDFNLPLYQWDDQEYWREDSIHQELRINGPSIDTLGTSNSSISPFVKSFTTFIDIEKSPYSYLKGHVVKNKYYFPGCGYIDNLFKTYQNQDITIDFLEFKAPLIFIEGVNQCLQTNIYQTGKTEYKVLYHFKDQKTNQWVQCSSGNFQLFNHGSNEFKLNINNIIENQCNIAKIYKNELYEHIKQKTGIQYTAAFQSVNECHIGNGCSLSVVSLELPIGYIDQTNNSSLFNTSILDCCLHGLVVLIDEQCQLVFDKIERLKLYSSNLPRDRNKFKNIYVYSKLNQKIGNSYIGSLEILLEDGTILIEIDKVVCTSLTPIKDSLVIEQPINQTFSTYLQLFNSILPTPSTFENLYKHEVNDQQVENYSNSLLFISNQLYNNIFKRNSQLSIELIKSLSIDQLKSKYLNNTKNEKLFKFVFNVIKEYYCDSNDQVDMLDIGDKELLKKSTRIIPKLLFPLENEDPSIDTPQSLFEDDLLEEFYNKPLCSIRNELFGQIIKNSIKPIIKEKMVFRILEFGGGTSSLSKQILNQLNQLLLEYPDNEIDIEYTWSDVSSSFISDAKNKLSNIKGLNIIYTTLDLEEPLIKKYGLKPSYYDIIIMANVIHVVKDLKYALNQIYQLLKPNGQMLLIEPPQRSIIVDSIFGCFTQWWTFEDNLRNDTCYLEKSKWIEVLKESNFKNDIIISEDTKYYCSAIQAQKESLDRINQSNNNNNNNSNGLIIIYCSQNENETILNHFKSLYGDSNRLFYISTISEINNLIGNNQMDENSIIYFLKATDQLTIENFKQVTLEYIQINQLLLKYKLNTKNILITLNSDTSNYLSSSVIGSARYFDEFQQLKLFTINFDSISIKSFNNFKLLPLLIDENFSIHKEFIIKNNNCYYERLKLEKNLNQNFKSDSYLSISKENKQSFIAKLNSNLEYELKPRQIELKPNEIEVKVLAFGINYKDFLVYTGNVPGEMANLKTGDINDPEFGNDFSGIISRIGEGSNLEKYNYKIGDEVYGIGDNTSCSHIVVDIDSVYYKPSGISHLEAASIPTIYMTSIYSIYNIGNLKDDEIILIHSASGGVGLATLNLLKERNHSSYIFVTVGSKEKEDYLRDTYGSFITGIFSTRNKNYYKEIKYKLKELGSNKNGVDLILNTLSSDFMDSNFQCLALSGRIIDLSITHLNHNEFINNNRFKYNFGYYNIELLFINNGIKRNLLKIIKKSIDSKRLINILPITEFNVNQVKESIEYINQRKHIGKIAVNNNIDLVDNLIANQSSIDVGIKEKPIIKLDYEIINLGENILVTGQSGIILDILKWICKYCKAVKNIIVLTKSAMKWGLKLLINSNKHINFYFKSIDIGDTNSLEQSIIEILENNSIKNIESIFHFAFTHVVSKVNEINMDHLDISHGAKTMGAINLHNLSIKLNWKINNFIMASSVASIVGSELQCTYVSSNHVLDRLSSYRKSIGLPSICTNWGMVGSSGFVARNQSVEVMLDGQGLNPVTINTFLGSLDLQIQNQGLSTNLVISDFNFERFIGFNRPIFNKFDFQLNIIRNSKLANQLRKVENDLDLMFLNKISEVLSIDCEKINPDIKILDYGADSLAIVQIKNWIDKEVSPNIITIQQLQNNSINLSIQTIKQQLLKKQEQNSQSSRIDNEKLKSSFTKINKLEYWKNEIKLDDSILNLISNNDNRTKDKQIIITNEMNILLTGTTGFLGAYLLYHLLKLNNCKKVYCIIRNKTNQNYPINEIINNLKNHLLFEKLNGLEISKIQAIVGDLTKNQFGLNDDQFKELSNKSNLIINSGADINLTVDYGTIKTVNVNGLKELIKLSLISNKPIPIANFSTYSVHMKQELSEEFVNCFDEQSFGLIPLDNIDILPGGYMQSKVIGEYLLSNQQLKIPYIIIRSPSIFSNPITGIGHQADFGQLFIQSCKTLGCYPNLTIGCLVSPVTWCAENFIKIIFNENSWSNNNTNPSSKLNVYNVNGNVIGSDTLVKECGKKIEFNEWKKLIDSSNHQSCIKLKTFHNLNYYRYNLFKGYNISNRTKELLISLGSYGNGGIVTQEYINNLIEYTINK